MNKTRRRIGRARRRKARLIHQIRNWTKTNYTEAPRRGPLRVPVLNLMHDVNVAMVLGLMSLEQAMASVLAFARAHGGA